MTRDDIVGAINALPHDWHGSGTMPADGIAAMAAVMAAMPPIEFSMETGSGKTTLLFSHLSACHKVFSLDSGTGSVRNVQESPLFNAAAVEYVEGPTQRTLPAYEFAQQLDIALLDGPHGYPFPDLEYYFVYPHLRSGGVLLGRRHPHPDDPADVRDPGGGRHVGRRGRRREPGDPAADRASRRQPGRGRLVEAGV